KTIFVFAGGSSHTLKEFDHQGVADSAGNPANPSANPMVSEEAKPGSESITSEENKFKAAKRPDFISRLKGYVDIFGVNRTAPSDNLYLVRRAVVWRSLFEGAIKKYPQLFEDKKKLRIHPSVLWAFLMVPQYKHGVRSMEAILNM